ncbi:hypothetical protein D3C80_2086370 [compost metagenome]
MVILGGDCFPSGNGYFFVAANTLIDAFMLTLFAGLMYFIESRVGLNVGLFYLFFITIPN